MEAAGTRGERQGESWVEPALLLEPAAPIPVECVELGAPPAWGTPPVRTGPRAPNWAFQAGSQIHRVWPLGHKWESKEGKSCAQGHSAGPRASGLSVLALWPTPAAPFPSSKVALPPPPISPSTHCPRAGAHALPETGSKGGSGLPLLTCGSSIHTEKHRGRYWALAGELWGSL